MVADWTYRLELQSSRCHVNEGNGTSLACRVSLLGRLCGTVSWRIAFGSDFHAA